ncbi:endomucin [Eudromia elegans]
MSDAQVTTKSNCYVDSTECHVGLADTEKKRGHEHKGKSDPIDHMMQREINIKVRYLSRSSFLLVALIACAIVGTSCSSSSENKLPEDTIHYSSVILPIVITLIVITLSVFSLVALYRMCQKKTPERQENGTEQAQSDKEGVKLLSVKTTSAETDTLPMASFSNCASFLSFFVEVRDLYEVGFSLPSANLYELTTPSPTGEVSQGRTTGEHSSQGKNKARQHDDSSSLVSNKYM